MTKEEKIKILNEYDDNLIRNLVPFAQTKNKVVLDINDDILNKIKTYTDEWYVINSKKNVIKFTYSLQNREPIIIIAEWTNEKDGRIIYCTYTEDIDEDIFLEHEIDERKINILLDILNIFKFFKNPYKGESYDKTVDVVMRLEVQIDDKYKEIIDVSPTSGVIYEMGEKLYKYSRARIKKHIFV